MAPVSPYRCRVGGAAVQYFGYLILMASWVRRRPLGPFKDAVYKGAAAIRPINVPCPHIRVIPGIWSRDVFGPHCHEPFYEVKARLIRSASTANRHSDIAPPVPGRAVVLKWLCGHFPGITGKCEPGASS